MSSFSCWALAGGLDVGGCEAGIGGAGGRGGSSMPGWLEVAVTVVEEGILRPTPAAEVEGVASSFGGASSTDLVE